MPTTISPRRPVAETVDRSTALLAEEQKTFFSNSNTQAQVTANRSRLVVVLLIGLGGVIVGAVLLGVWRTSSGLRQLAGDLGQQAKRASRERGRL